MSNPMADERVTTVAKVIAWLERAATHAQKNPSEYAHLTVSEAYAAAARTLRVWPENLDGR